jgi:hypothetical protein
VALISAGPHPARRSGKHRSQLRHGRNCDDQSIAAGFGRLHLPQQDLGKVRDALQQNRLSKSALDRDNLSTLSDGTLAVLDNQIDSPLRR